VYHKVELRNRTSQCRAEEGRKGTCTDDRDLDYNVVLTTVCVHVARARLLHLVTRHHVLRVTAADARQQLHVVQQLGGAERHCVAAGELAQVALHGGARSSRVRGAQRVAGLGQQLLQQRVPAAHLGLGLELGLGLGLSRGAQSGGTHDCTYSLTHSLTRSLALDEVRSAAE
jgi:hypothetical protein